MSSLARRIVTKILKGFGILIGLAVLYLAVIIFLPILKVAEQPIQPNYIKGDVPACRQDVTFMVNGSILGGWFYLPEDKTNPVPCIVLNQGFCGTKDMFLENYALRFGEAGFAALTFDYRHFGDSQGEPRQVYSVSKQIEDIKAAVKYARTRNEVDPEKVVIWGTSAAGNYGIIIAAEDKNIACVIGQSASLDHEADGKKIFKQNGIGWLLKLIVHAQRDKGRSRFGLSSHTFPAIGKPGTTAMLTAPGFYEGYQKITRNSKTFKNEVCARIMFASHGPDLLKAAEKVRCPVLFHICENDTLAVPDSHKKIEKILDKKVKFIKYSIGHFDIYFGEYFEKSINDQITFLKKHLQ